MTAASYHGSRAGCRARKMLRYFWEMFIFAGETETNNAMTTEEKSLVKKQTEELLKLLLKKTNTTHQAIVRAAEEDFIIANLDVLTAAERKRFDKLVLN